MVGPFPTDPHRIDGGVSAALMYLSGALAASGEAEILGARIREGDDEGDDIAGFEWPVFDIALGHGSLTTLYRRQQRRLDVLIRRLRPDVLHAHGADISGYLAVRSHVPTVVTVHGLLMACAVLQTDIVERARSMLAAALTERGTVRRATDLIAISPYVRFYYGADLAGRCHDIPNAVAPAYFDVARRPQRGRFLFAGKISRGKGLADLLDSVALNPSSELEVVLAGGVPDRTYERRLRDRAKTLKLGESVKFLGLLEESSLLREFERATALVLPSYQETAPMVVQQAMAAGLPVIATRVGGVPHQIEHGVTGFLFEPGDTQTLAALMSQLTEDPKLSLAVGTAGKAVALERYQAGTVASATAVVYRDIMSRSRKDALK